MKILSLLRKEGLSFRFLFILLCLVIPLFICFCIIALYAYSVSNNSYGVFATLFMVTYSSYAVGNILGFLFGIPKTVQSQTDSASIKKDTAYQVNTSLEQISDWLTKMVIGAGLVELKDIIIVLENISANIASDIGDEQSQSIIIASIICFMILGFFVTYLSTRLYITNALAAANVELQEDADEDNRKASL